MSPVLVFFHCLMSHETSQQIPIITRNSAYCSPSLTSFTTVGYDSGVDSLCFHKYLHNEPTFCLLLALPHSLPSFLLFLLSFTVTCSSRLLQSSWIQCPTPTQSTFSSALQPAAISEQWKQQQLCASNTPTVSDS